MTFYLPHSLKYLPRYNCIENIFSCLYVPVAHFVVANAIMCRDKLDPWNVEDILLQQQQLSLADTKLHVDVV